jgi:1-acyl-sn-glycerol-3-phosphate acyltransferase
MKLNRFKTSWKIIVLTWYTAVVSARSVYKYFLGTTTRPWVDKTIHNWIDQLLNTVRVHYKVINPHNTQPIPGRATILMCNHSSAYDIPLAFKAFPKHSIRMLSKKELSKIPLFGKAMVAAEFPFVDRKNRYQAMNDLAFASKLMESGIILWIAPEGTRSKNGNLAPFKKGAFVTAIQAKAIIIPIGIKGAFDILPARTFNINLDQNAEIHIGKPIDTSEFNLANKQELIDQTYTAIQELIA